MDITEQHVGRRIREVRSWRRLDQKVVAELAGITPAYLSYIERGLRPVTSRKLLESIAAALRVAPSDLTGGLYTPSDESTAEAYAVIPAVESVLEAVDLGVVPDGITADPWPKLRKQVIELNTKLRPEADYGAQGRLVPDLLLHLYAAYVQQPEHRRDILVGLVHTLHSAAILTKNLGVRGLPIVAARLGQECAEKLESPEWLGFAAWLRGNVTGSNGRAAQYAMSVRAIDQLTSHLGDVNSLQSAGMLHLQAALAAAAQDNGDTAQTHLNEAAELARTLPDQRENFCFMHFGEPNVDVWRVSLETELGGATGKVAELARRVNPEALPAKARRAAFYADWGRSLVAERSTVEEGIGVLAKAEATAPLWVHNNVFVREAVSDLLRRARREAGSPELRHLAWRMGVAPTR
jgi:transcriptional regulator with XRE-family HTH domain